MSRRALLLLLCAALCCAPACNAVSLQRRYVERRLRAEAIHDHTLDLPSGRLRFYSGGAGSPVLLVHGFGFSAVETWRHQLVALSRDHTVFAPDIYWFGGSEPRDRAAMDTAAQQADGLVELLDRLGLGRVDVVGVSFGGFIALELALRHPERVRRLALLDSAGIEPTAAEERAVSASFPYARGSVARLLIPESTAELRVFLDRVFYRAPYIPWFVMRQVLAEFWRNREAKLRMAAHLSRQGFLSLDALSAIRAPALVLWGRHDRLLVPSLGARLAGAIPGARLVFLERSGHSPMLEQPEEVTRLLTTFLADPPP